MSGEKTKHDKTPVVIVSGVSGVGKGTVIDRLCAAHNEFKLVKSDTTRPSRGPGDFYNFLSVEAYKQNKLLGEYIESNFYNENYYGTSRKELLAVVREGKIPVLDVDTNGYTNLMKDSEFENNMQQVYVYLTAPPGLVYQRLMERKETVESILSRMKSGVEDIRHALWLNPNIIENDQGKAGETAELLYRLVKEMISGKLTAETKCQLVSEDILKERVDQQEKLTRILEIKVRVEANREF